MTADPTDRNESMKTAPTPRARILVNKCRELGRIEIGVMAALQDLVSDAQDMDEVAVEETLWLAHQAITDATAKLGECCIILEGQGDN